MRFKLLFSFIIVVLFTFPAFAATNEQLSLQAVSDDNAVAKTAIEQLRQAGQKGLDELFKTHAAEIERYSKTGVRTDSWFKIAAALDGVSLQKDAYASQLFWFTDLEAAKASAKQAAKPILSLRLLGNLNEEFSCANSRFFRSLLYSNPEISKILRENYILHWKSERPAPRITIDYGDGRKIERTITGNSIHYFLDDSGKIIDALPGLYSPQEFLKYLKSNLNLYQALKKTPENLSMFQNLRRAQLLNKWKRDMTTRGISVPEAGLRTSEAAVAPTALRAAPIAVTKMVVELRTVSKLALDEESLFSTEIDLEGWKSLSATFEKPKFANETLRFIRHQTIGNKDLNDRRFSEMVANLEKYVAIDTARNEYLLHTKIYEMLMGNSYKDVEQFNKDVYSQLFLTPRSDEWLGLYSSDIYTALDRNGIER